MSNTQPTEPLPPHQDPGQHGYAPQAAYEGRPPAAVVVEPFYKRHGLAFAISTLVLSVVILLGLITAGTFAVVGVVTHVGERAISRVVPHGQPQPGVPGMPGKPGEGGGNGGGKGGGQGDSRQNGRVLVRGTIASVTADTWTIDRQNGGSVKVRVDGSTAFGVPGQPGSSSDFAKGDEVIVIGTRSGSTLTAARVLKLDDFPTRPPSTPGPSTPGP